MNDSVETESADCENQGENSGDNLDAENSDKNSDAEKSKENLDSENTEENGEENSDEANPEENLEAGNSEDNNVENHGAQYNEPNWWRALNSEDDDDDDEEPVYEIVSERRRYYKHFRTYGGEVTLQMKQPKDAKNMMRNLQRTLSEIHRRITVNNRDTDYIAVSCRCSSFSSGPSHISFRPIRDFHPDEILDIIYRAVQSNADFDITEPMNIIYGIVQGVTGGGRVKCTLDNTKKKSILTIDNNDNLCFPRSLVTAKAYKLRGQLRSGALHRKWLDISHIRSKNQRQEASELVRVAKVRIPRNGCGLEEISDFQNYFSRQGFAIVVYDRDNFGNEGPLFFDGRPLTIDRFGSILHTINVLYYSNKSHYEPILNLSAAAGTEFFCELCNKAYRRVSSHRCNKMCPRCRNVPKCETGRYISCDQCNRNFFGQNCFDRHLQNDSYPVSKSKTTSVCSAIRICKDCCKRLNPKEKHACGTTKCGVCHEMVPYGHLCYMQPLKPKKKSKVLYVFYDFETRQDKLVEGHDDVYEHEVNLCVLQQACTVCIDNEDLTRLCHSCGIREHVFKTEPVKQFVEYVLRENTSFEKIICLAHNAKNFDLMFVMRYIVEQKKLTPELILTGSKITRMACAKTIFIDSINYFQMALSKLPKTFDLPDSKSYFPHLFNTQENQDYLGIIPDKKYYSPDTMKVGDRESFIKWHDEMREQN